jgi:NitT/TauT family transport system permease protein
LFLPRLPVRKNWSTGIHDSKSAATASRTLLIVFGIVALLLIVVEAVVSGGATAVASNNQTSMLPYFAFRTLSRMTIAYGLALGFALAYGITTALNHRASHVMLPLLDIFQSVPVLGFLPIVFFLVLQKFPQTFAGTTVGAELASIIMIFTAMAWSPTFGVIAGVNAIPVDIKEAAQAYGLRGFSYLRQIVLPAVYPELVWSSILAWGSGWYLIPIEEYIPGLVSLPGLGSYISIAAANQDLASSLFGLLVLVGVIFAIDRLVWRPLGMKADKYKYETVAAPRGTESSQTPLSQGLRRYEGRIVSPVTSFFKSEKSYFARVVEVTRLRRLIHATEKLRFPERLGSRIPFWGKIASYMIFLGLVALALAIVIPARSQSIVNSVSSNFSLLAANVTAIELFTYTLLSVSRLVVAYSIALAWTLGAGILIARSQRLSHWLVPIFDIGQSIPATALFPLVVILLVDPFKNTPYLGLTLNLASIILILTGMQWYLLFNIVGAVNGVPNDILEATASYGVKGRRFVREILIPASFPAILIGSIQAWGGGWNALIVSEWISSDANVKGLGSFLVNASSLTAATDPTRVALGNAEIFTALLAMTATVLLINRLVWRRLLRKSDKYKFEA